MKLIIITGPPGAGKGTQAELLAEHHNFYTFSVGQLLRDAHNPATMKIVDAGTLLPVAQVVELVMEEIKNSARSVIVDGFPRRLDQAEVFGKLVGQNPEYELHPVAIRVSEAVSWQRVQHRGRADDAESVWRHRWDEYYRWTVPAIEYYQKQGNLIDLDGELDIKQVNTNLEQALGL